MGKPSTYTLVDVVADVFSGVSNAIGKIKDVANQALNAVKAGLEFIANAIIGLVLDGMEFTIELMMDMFKEIANTGFSFSISKSDGLYCLNNKCFGINRYQMGFEIIFPGLKIKLANMFNPGEFGFETLSPKTDAIVGISALFHIGSNLAIPDLTKTSQSKGMAAILGSLILQSMTYLVSTLLSLDPEEKSQLQIYYIFSGIISILGGLLSFGKFKKGDMFSLKLDGIIPYVRYIADAGRTGAFGGMLQLISALGIGVTSLVSLSGTIYSESSPSLKFTNFFLGVVGLYIGLLFDGFKNDRKNDWSTNVNMAIFNFAHGLLYLFIAFCLLD